MRISDWSSDVCSSDLVLRERRLADRARPDDQPAGRGRADDPGAPDRRPDEGPRGGHRFRLSDRDSRPALPAGLHDRTTPSAAARDRKSVGSGKRWAVPGVLGGCRIIKKKKKNK